MRDGFSTIWILSTIVLVAAREQCFVNWHGTERAFVICEEYCCGNSTYQYCCSDCFRSVNKNRVCEQLLIVIGIVILLVGSLVICLVMATCAHWDSVSKWADHYCTRQRRSQVAPASNEHRRTGASPGGHHFTGPFTGPFDLPRLPSYDECGSTSPPPPFTHTATTAPIEQPNQIEEPHQPNQIEEPHQPNTPEPDSGGEPPATQPIEGVSNAAYEHDSPPYPSYPPPPYELSISAPTPTQQDQPPAEEQQ